MCMVPKGLKDNTYQKNHELIQIGAIKLDDALQEIDRYSAYVRPEYGYIDSFIENLTGITPDDVKEAPLFEEALKLFSDWIGEEEAVCVSWSDSDKNQFRSEMKHKGIENLRMMQLFDTWVDCQKLFGQKLKSRRNFSLEEALIASDILQEGRAHDGLTDAVNTAKLYRKILLEPEFSLREDYKKAREPKVDHLQFSMAGLFQGIDVANLPAGEETKDNN